MQCLILDWILDWRENAIKDRTGSTDKCEFKQLIRQSVASVLNLLMLVTIPWFYGYVSGYSYS